MGITTRRTATLLGWAGVLPFVAAPLALIWSAAPAELIGAAFATYGLAIISFLVGSWWGIALLRREPWILVASNVVVVVACLAVVFLSLRSALLVQAFLLVGVFVLEQTHRMFRRQPGYYSRLRLSLSVVASVSLFSSAVLI